MKKRILSIVFLLTFAVSAFILSGCGSKKTEADSETVRQFTVVCVDAQGTEQHFELSSARKTLGEALRDEKMIDGEDGPYGLQLITVCGISADWTKDGAYWAIYIGDDYALYGVDGIEIVDGTVYKFVWTKM